MNYKKKLKLYTDKKRLNKLYNAYHIPTSAAIVHFINTFCFTFNPRNENDKIIPFVLYKKQTKFIEWIWEKYTTKNNGVVEKCRDIGATWCFCAFCVYMLLFQKNTSCGIYTYKQSEVDLAGDVSTIFGKINFMIDRLPIEFRPGITSKYMYIRNNDNGSDIAGACGDNPGRGGRRSIFFKDEAAFYQREQLVEAALSETSDCIIDVSTHAGTNTLFYRKTTTDQNVFTFDWWDNPGHTQKWFDKKRELAEQKGTLHIFQREVERNAAASVENTVVSMEWANSIKKCDRQLDGRRIAGLDVADEGGDTNAFVIMDGNIIIYIEEWSEGDTIQTADRAFWRAIEYNCEEFRYDSIGVGAGIRARVREIQQKEKIDIQTVAWNAGGAVIRPYDRDYSDMENRRMFENAKSQAWWRIREQCNNTYRYNNKMECDEDNVISAIGNIDSNKLQKLIREIAQPQHDLTARGKIIIKKKPKGTKSPNIAEAFLIARAETAGNLKWSVI